MRRGCCWVSVARSRVSVCRPAGRPGQISTTTGATYRAMPHAAFKLASGFNRAFDLRLLLRCDASPAWDQPGADDDATVICCDVLSLSLSSSFFRLFIPFKPFLFISIRRHVSRAARIAVPGFIGVQIPCSQMIRNIQFLRLSFTREFIRDDFINCDRSSSCCWCTSL